MSVSSKNCVTNVKRRWTRTKFLFITEKIFETLQQSLIVFRLRSSPAHRIAIQLFLPCEYIASIRSHTYAYVYLRKCVCGRSELRPIGKRPELVHVAFSRSELS